MRFKIALLIVSVPLLAQGGEGLYHAVSNQRQTPMTCGELAQQPPRALWIKVTNCEIDYVGASYRDASGRINEFYFPVRPTGQPRTAPAALVAATRDPDVLALAQTTIGDNRQPDQETFLVMMLRIVTMLKASREVEGYVRTGMLRHLQTQRALSDLNTPLAPGFVVLDLHARPRFLTSTLEVAAGMSVLLWWGLLTIRPRELPQPVSRAEALAPVPVPAMAEISQHEITAAFEPLVPQEPPAPRAPQPAMLLLNLDAQADVGAIEFAPPLGSLGEVRQRLSEACPALRFDDGGRATLDGPGFSLAVDAGQLEPVWTATVYPHGDGATDAARALAGSTGWRLFVPKQGVFLPALDQEAVR